MRNDNKNFFNSSFDQPLTRAISPKLKKNLLINMPTQNVKKNNDSQKMLNTTQKGSRTGISVAAPTIEA